MYLHITYRCISALANWPTPFSAVQMYSILKEYLQVYLCCCCLPTLFSAVQKYSVITEYLEVYLCSFWLDNTIFCYRDVQYTYKVLAGVSLLLPVGQQHHCLDVQFTYRLLASVFMFLLVGPHQSPLYRCKIYLHSTCMCILSVASRVIPFTAGKMSSVHTGYFQVYICSCRMANNIFRCTDIQWTYRVLTGVSLLFPFGRHHSLLYRCTMSLQSTWRCISALTVLATLFSTVQMYFVLTEYLQVYICSSRLANTNLSCTGVQCTYTVLTGVSLLLRIDQHYSLLYMCTMYLQSTCRCISALSAWRTLFSAV